LNFKNDPCLLEVVASFTDPDFEGGIKRDVANGMELVDVEDSPTAYEQ